MERELDRDFITLIGGWMGITDHGHVHLYGNLLPIWNNARSEWIREDFDTFDDFFEYMEHREYFEFLRANGHIYERFQKVEKIYE